MCTYGNVTEKGNCGRFQFCEQERVIQPPFCENQKNLTVSVERIDNVPIGYQGSVVKVK